ncbi:hypothetical protein PW52_14890 [Tamlana sedimentorum]|uniref:Uncharacterized protein n=1 Tax=Neotamlana sedimentorum TaxID=1435349 RepID=A0A0D7W121_9FLAO|nr:hypothetical protein [Tamlana sedimentorum]KJD32766.1 hypothetical protein PW52_14890 [Tamlana sedimentorum]
MNTITKHIVFKILTLTITATLFLPTLIKVNHIFEHHEHEYSCCTSDASAHVHNIDHNCEFQKFQLNHFFTLTTQTFATLKVLASNKIALKTYNFVVKQQHLSFSLRAPPAYI